MQKRKVNVAMIGYDFMGRAHSNAWRQVGRFFQDLPVEPVMKVEVVTPDEFVGSVQGDLNGRRGQIKGIELRGGVQAIAADVPLSAMFGYVSSLRSMSQGRASYTMQFSHYDRVPRQVVNEMLGI